MERFATHPRWAATAFGAVTLAVFLSRLVLTGEPYLASADTLPTRLLPVCFLRAGTTNLDRFFPPVPGQSVPYFLQPRGGHYYSAFPIGGPLLLTPVYVALDLAGVPILDDGLTRDRVVGSLAAILSALSAVVIFVTYAPRGPGRALAVAAVYAFGTGVWPTCAQDLWQHTFGVLFLALALYCVERGTLQPAWYGRTGLPAGLLFLVRPANGLIVALLAALVVWRRPRALIVFAAWGLPFLAATLAYNLSLGHLFGAYRDEASGIDPLHRLATGLPGLLVSPGRGLLIFSPVLALGLLAFGGRADPERRPLRWVLLTMIVTQLVVYGSYQQWYGGHCFGPRFLLEVMPAAAALLWEAWPRLTASRLGVVALVLTAGWSVLANGTGYVIPWGYWCGYPDVDRCTARLWDWRDSPVIAALAGFTGECPHPVAPGDVPQSGDVAIDARYGWLAIGPYGAVAGGPTAEADLDCRGAPVRALELTLRRDPRLGGQAQAVVARLDGQERATLSLADDDAHRLEIPLRPDETRGPHRLTLHFAARRRAAWSDPRPVAARVEEMAVQLRQPQGVSAPPPPGPR